MQYSGVVREKSVCRGRQLHRNYLSITVAVIILIWFWYRLWFCNFSIRIIRLSSVLFFGFNHVVCLSVCFLFCLHKTKTTKTKQLIWKQNSNNTTCTTKSSHTWKTKKQSLYMVQQKLIKVWTGTRDFLCLGAVFIKQVYAWYLSVKGQKFANYGYNMTQMLFIVCVDMWSIVTIYFPFY